MLKELKISQIILIDNADLHFENGFTVLSGETGAGKSAIMEALNLVLGGKTDAKLIRNGQEKGSVTAVFESNFAIKEFLLEKGFEPADSLIIQREITVNGKSRSWINHQPAQLKLIQQITDHLVELVGQKSNHKLLHLDAHRQILDLFGAHPLAEYENAWKKLQSTFYELQQLKNAMPERFREIATCKREIEEIEEAQIKEGEDESLFQTYSLLSSVKDRAIFTSEMTSGLSDSLSFLQKIKTSYASLLKADPYLEEELALYPQIVIEIEELLHSLTKYENRLESDPEQLHILHQRLTLIEKIKRKFGNSLEEIQNHLNNQKARLKVLENIENELILKNEAYEKQLKETENLAENLTAARKNSSKKFSQAMKEELASLNMKDSEFFIEITRKELNLSGQDQIEFFLLTNLGEKQIALKESASGGELARILLAIHLLLAHKEKIGTLIFDEIDANIGGTTAAMIGHQLEKLGKHQQILAITHFPQVAKCADHHLQIKKSTASGRTLSHIQYLDGKTKGKELSRMAGVYQT